MLTSEATNPAPRNNILASDAAAPELNVTAKYLDQAMKKQLRAFQADIHKSQEQLFERIMKAMRAELRRYVELEDVAPAGILSIVEEDASKKMPEKTNKIKTQKKGMSMSPFKSRNAKLNDADDLDSQHRRTVLLLQAQALMAEALTVEVEQATNEAENSSVRYSSARGLEMVEAETNKSDVLLEKEASAEPIVKADALPSGPTSTQEISSARSNEPQQPLLAPVQPLIPHPKVATPHNPDFDWTIVLYDPKFEGAIVCLVILNALWIGAELEYQLSVTFEGLPFFHWIDVLFCALFTFELLFRMFVLRLDFFDPRGPQWIWNCFDIVLVLSQLTEIIFEYDDVREDVNVSWLRILRILRVMRLTRIVRAIRFVEGLRTLVKCLVRGMKATGWITLFLVMQIYTCSLAFTEVVYDLRMNSPNELTKRTDLVLMFGSLRTTMGTLIKSIIGGITWETALSPLMDVSQTLGFAFMTYVCFSVLVVLNVIMGFYVNTSCLCSDEDTKKNLRDHVADIFVQDGESFLGAVDEDLFRERVNSPEMQAYFQSIDLHADEAEGLFKLLDLDNNGMLDPIECVSALVRMQGNAKALDLRIMMFMCSKAHEWNAYHMSMLEERIAELHFAVVSRQETGGATVGQD